VGGKPEIIAMGAAIVAAAVEPRPEILRKK
jgi:hypothetical protein